MVTELSLSWTGPYKFACERTENDIKFSWPAEEIDWETDRLVYVLGFLPPYYVEYKKKESSVCYVGRGKQALRVLSHREVWFRKVAILLESFAGYQVWACQPRLRGSPKVYEDVEEDVIMFFTEVHGERPLFNQRFGGKWSGRTYDHSAKIETKRIFAAKPTKDFSRPVKSLFRQAQSNAKE